MMQRLDGDMPGAPVGDGAGAPTDGNAGAPVDDNAGAPESREMGAPTDAPMSRARLRNMNTDALAYMGDAVYEQMVREMLLRRGINRADRLHRTATSYVSAPAQAKVLRLLYEELTEEEQAMVRRWRNHKYHSKARSADPMTYKRATAFEALVGYLYLSGDTARLDWLFTRAASVIDGAAE